jgi:hypothetical protein
MQLWKDIVSDGLHEFLPILGAMLSVLASHVQVEAIHDLLAHMPSNKINQPMLILVGTNPHIFPIKIYIFFGISF